MQVLTSQNIVKSYTDGQFSDQVDFCEGITFNYFVYVRDSSINLLFNTLGKNIKWNIFVLFYGEWKCDGNIVVNLDYDDVEINVLMVSFLQDDNSIVANWDINVWKNIVNTQWHLLEKNIVLGDNIHIKATPRLDVYSSDVQATHGVSINKIIPENLFYMMSKGLSGGDALKLCVSGVIESILSNFNDIEDDRKSTIEKEILSFVKMTND